MDVLLVVALIFLNIPIYYKIFKHFFPTWESFSKCFMSASRQSELSTLEGTEKEDKSSKSVFIGIFVMIYILIFTEAKIIFYLFF